MPPGEEQLSLEFHTESGAFAAVATASQLTSEAAVQYMPPGKEQVIAARFPSGFGRFAARGMSQLKILPLPGPAADVPNDKTIRVGDEREDEEDQIWAAQVPADVWGLYNSVTGTPNPSAHSRATKTKS